jgi:hypothetical protein
MEEWQASLGKQFTTEQYFEIGNPGSHQGLSNLQRTGGGHLFV